MSVAQEHHVHGQVLSYERGYFYALYGFSRLLLLPVFFIYVFVGVMLAIWVVPMITMCFSVVTMMCLSVVICGFGSQQGYSLKKVVVLGRFFKSESLERSINWHNISNGIILSILEMSATRLSSVSSMLCLG